MVKRTDKPYDFADELGLDAMAAVRPGTSILVSGPAMTGKDALLYELLASGVERDEAGIVVTTEDDGAEAFREIESYAHEVDRSLLAAIDCRAKSGRDERESEDGSFVYSVAGPSKLTGTGIGITRCFDRMREAEVTRGRMGLNSLSTMVYYTDRETVFKFCHILSQRLDAAGFVGLFALNTAAHDSHTVEVIKQAFDAHIEVRTTDGERHVRVEGIEATPTTWQTL